MTVELRGTGYARSTAGTPNGKLLQRRAGSGFQEIFATPPLRAPRFFHASRSGENRIF